MILQIDKGFRAWQESCLIRSNLRLGVSLNGFRIRSNMDIWPEDLGGIAYMNLVGEFKIWAQAEWDAKITLEGFKKYLKMDQPYLMGVDMGNGRDFSVEMAFKRDPATGNLILVKGYELLEEWYRTIKQNR